MEKQTLTLRTSLSPEELRDCLKNGNHGASELILVTEFRREILNTVLRSRVTFDNLRPGGYLALETQVYDHPEDPNICYFMQMQNNDPTNFWALRTGVLTTCLEFVGFREIQQLLKVVPTEGLAQHMSRIILVARKPE